MAQVSFNIRMDENTKKEADILFKEMGFTMTSAINAFIKQALLEQGMPFQITRKTVLSDKLAKNSVSQLQAIVDYVNDYCGSKGIDKLPGICLPSLKDKIEMPILRAAQEVRYGKS